MTIYHGNVPERIVTDLAGHLPPNSRVLDLGCGIGRNAIPLAKAGHMVEGRDKSESELRALCDHARAESVTIETLCTDIRSLRIGYKTWNAILAILILNQLTKEDGETMLRNIIINVLPEGYLALVALTSQGDLAKTFDRNYYPPAQSILKHLEGWDILTHEVAIVPCKTNSVKSGLSNERVTVLARKPL